MAEKQLRFTFAKKNKNMKKGFITLGIFSALTLGALTITSCGGETKTETAEAAIYQCPMDCEDGKTYDKEGICPVCEMELRPVEKEAEGSQGAHSH